MNVTLQNAKMCDTFVGTSTIVLPSTCTVYIHLSLKAIYVPWTVIKLLKGYCNECQQQSN